MNRRYSVSLLLSGVATAIGSGAMGVMLSYIIKEYDLAVFQEGWMSSCISAGALIALIIGIFLRARIPKVWFILFGGILMSLMLLLKSQPVSFPLFLILCLLMGIGMGIMDCFQSALLSDLDPVHTAKNLGLFHAIFGLGGVILPLVLKKLLSVCHWRTVYLLIGIAALVLVLQFVTMTYRCRNMPELNKLEKTQSFRQLKAFIKTPYFRLLLLGMFVGAAAQNGILLWTVLYVSSTLGDTVLAPVCLSGFWISSTISRLLAPRLPMRPMAVLAIGSIVSGTAWCAGIWQGSSVGVLAACVIAGLTSGCCIPLLLSEGALFSQNNTGLTTSTLMFVKTTGQMLNPIFISQMQVFTGVRSAMLLIGIIFVIDGIIAAVMAAAGHQVFFDDSTRP